MKIAIARADYLYSNCDQTFTRHPVINVIYGYNYNEITDYTKFISLHVRKHILPICVSIVERAWKRGYMYTRIF